MSSYSVGRYNEAESQARTLLNSVDLSPQERAQARWISAFAASRRQDFREARQEFAKLRREAKSQPWMLLSEEKPTSTSEAQPNDRHTEPALEEDAACQHAVLTVALGEKDAATAEFMQFLRDFPESPLVHAAARRLVKLYGDHVPKEVEAAYQKATRTAQAREQARERERSLCAPEVLAELLRRRSGESASVPAVDELAKELGTTHEGTTLKSLAEGARRHGLQAKGLQLSWDGLVSVMHGRSGIGGPPGPEVRTHASSLSPHPSAKAPYVVALVSPGHLVLVEDVSSQWVRVWDPSAHGLGQPGRREYTPDQWRWSWGGVALALY